VGENSVLVHNTCPPQKPSDVNPKLVDGAKMSSDDALDAAIDYVGEGYWERPITIREKQGVFVSADKTRQVRLTSSDLQIVGNHCRNTNPRYKGVFPPRCRNNQ
jgi:hypothetical protein